MSPTSGSGSIVVDSTPSWGISISYEANQLRRRFPSSTSDTRTHRAVNVAESIVVTNSVPRGTDCQVYSPAAGACATGDCSAGGTGLPAVPPSGRISIRQPVRRAASRAFCPSRPMAKDN